MYTVTKEILYMPGLITNYLFGERSYQLLSPNYLKEIKMHITWDSRVPISSSII